MLRPFVMKDVWNIHKQNFNEYALQMFQFQAKNNKVYAEYLQLIGKSPELVNHVQDIPYLPISFFKSHVVKSLAYKEEKVFESSSTTGKGVSKHYLKSEEEYHRTAELIFESAFGALNKLEVVGLLPHYLEKGQSSLVSMVNHLANKSTSAHDPFYLYDHDALAERLKLNNKTVLFGVGYALLDFVAGHHIDNPNLIVIETGGMKGRKQEITKEELHEQLQVGFRKATIRSEYGMTELMSQAYTDQTGRYQPPPWMQISCRADNDPLSQLDSNKRGALNIIDLANIHSCAFIATDDLGRVYQDGSFEILGRLDQADLRGCSLLIA